MSEIISMTFGEFLEENVRELTSKLPWMEEKDLKLCETVEELSSFVDKAVEKGVCSLDLETNGLSTRIKKVDNNISSVTKIIGFCVAYDIDSGLYVPIEHREGSEYNLSKEEVLKEINRLCQNCITVYHNSKYDRALLNNYGIKVDQYDRFEDTILLAHLYDAGQKDHGLKFLSNKYLNQPMIELKTIAKEGKFDLVSPKIGYVYGASDAVCTLHLFYFFMSQNIIKEQMAIYRLEKKIAIVVMSMEFNLVKIDVEYLRGLKVEIERQLDSIRKEMYKIAGKEFNIGSPKQLGIILFDELGYRYPEKKKTASGQYITDNSSLEKISDEYPVVKKLIQYRGLEKSLGTYVENLIKNRDEDNCIKLNFNQYGTETGRFSSPGGKGINIDGYSGVNVQSIPANYSSGVPDIRRSFIARPGNKIVAMDYSGEELRVATNLSREPKWLEEFIHGSGDLHTKTGQIIFGRQKITKEERQIAKTVNFQTLYGSGPRGIAAQAKISEREARRILVSFFDGLPKLKRWIDVEKAKARKLKYVKTCMGRIRPLNKFYGSGDRGLEAHADRCAVNFLVQGSCADIMKLAMMAVYNWIMNNNLQDEIRMLITVHDEIVYEMPEEKLDLYIPKLNNIMKMEHIIKNSLEWPVLLTLDAEYGDSWHVEKDYFKDNPDKLNFVPDDDEIQNSQYNVKKDSIKPEKEERTKKKEIIPAVSSENKEKSEDINQEDFSLINENDSVKEIKSDIIHNEVQIDSKDQFVYTIKDTTESVLRRLNEVISFLQEENNKNIKYLGPKKVLILKTKEGYILTVSNLKVCVDAFLAFARYWGI